MIEGDLFSNHSKDVSKPQIMLVDGDARQQALDISRSICVTAPAGSGKTELLTQRMLKLLAVVDHPEAILAITFTRKAAAEMRERLLDALQLGLDPKEPVESHKKQTWQLARAVLEKNNTAQWDLLNNPARLRLQTIDSLCQSIASDLPVLSELGAKLKPVDDPSGLYRQAIDAFLAELEDNSEIATVISQVLMHLDNNVARLYKLFIDMLPLRDQWLGHAASYQGNDDTRYSLEQTLQRWIEQELAAGRALLHGIEGELCACADFAGSQLQKMPAESAASGIGVLAGINQLPSADFEQHGQWAAIIELLCTKEGKLRKKVDKRQGFPAKTATKDKALAAEYEQRKRAMMELLALAKEIPDITDSLAIVAGLPFAGYEDRHWQILEPLTICLVRAYAHLRLVFGKTGQCDYNEITDSALRALTSADADIIPDDQQQAADLFDTATAIAYKWNQNISHILVDEFQDTAVSQFDLLKALSAEWHQENLTGDKPTKTLFVVGDGMQSIYGFRAAKVGLFLTAKQNGIGDLPLHAVELVQNFRSTKQVVDWNNRHFDNAFPAKVDISRGAVPYSKAQSIQSLTDDADTENHSLNDNSCQLLICTGDDARLTEAECIVKSIQTQHADKPQVSIAILVRFRSHLAEVIPALNEAGIAWQGLDIDPLKNREVIMDCLSLARALLNPVDNIAWLALLRGPWCGLSLVDLQTLVDATTSNNSRPSFNGLVNYLLEPDSNSEIVKLLNQNSDQANAHSTLSNEAYRRLQIFADKIAMLWSKRGRKPLRQWLESGWQQLNGPLLASFSYDGDDIGSVQAFFDLLEKLEQECLANGSVFSLAILEQSIERLYTPAAATDANVDISDAVKDCDKANAVAAVQIMTIHKSKGLEFDSVIIPCLDRVGPSDDKPLLSWNEHLFSDGDAGLVLCPIQASSVYDYDQADKELSDFTANGKSTGPAINDSLYQFLRDENKRVSNYESARLLYVAATRAKSRLLLLAHLDTDDNEQLKSPLQNALLSRLWTTVKDEAIIVSGEVTGELDSADISEPNYPLLKRLRLPVLNSLEDYRQRKAERIRLSSAEEQSQLADKENIGDDGKDNSTASLVGTCVHEILERIAKDGLQQWRSQINKVNDSVNSPWYFRLIQLGVAQEDIEQALALVNKAVETVLNSDNASWLFDANHQHARNEWALSSVGFNGSLHNNTDAISATKVMRYIIDRSFIDADNQRWIIDYKVTAPDDNTSVEDFIEQQKQRYQAQLTNYKQLVIQLDKTENPDVTVSKCALYLPLIDTLVELA